jgi:hypothetical protein
MLLQIEGPKGNPNVLTAIAGKADVLCTLDRHVHEPQIVSFCAGQGIRILGDAELLPELLA